MKKIALLTTIQCLFLISVLSFAAVKINPVKIYEAGIKAYESENYKKASRLFEDAIEAGLSGNHLKDAYFKLYSIASLVKDSKRIEFYESKCKWLKLAPIEISKIFDSETISALKEFPFPNGLVNDFANVISIVYQQEIQAITNKLFNKTGIPVVSVTMADIGGAEYNDYAHRLYDAWGIGKKGEDKGVLIFVTIKERKMRIETGAGMENILPDGLVGEIRDRYMIPYLKQNKFGEGFLKGADAISKVIIRHTNID